MLILISSNILFCLLDLFSDRLFRRRVAGVPARSLISVADFRVGTTYTSR